MTLLRKPYSHLDLSPSTLLSVRLNDSLLAFRPVCLASSSYHSDSTFSDYPCICCTTKRVKTSSDYKGAFQNLLCIGGKQEWDVGTRITGCIRLSSTHFHHLIGRVISFEKDTHCFHYLFLSRQTFIQDGGYCSHLIVHQIQSIIIFEHIIDTTNFIINKSQFLSSHFSFFVSTVSVFSIACPTLHSLAAPLVGRFVFGKLPPTNPARV
jgi:hypothetical protein